jgi:hypothetical protein
VAGSDSTVMGFAFDYSGVAAPCNYLILNELFRDLLIMTYFNL